MVHSILERAEPNLDIDYYGYYPERYLFGSKSTVNQRYLNTLQQLTSKNRHKFLKVLGSLLFISPFRINKYSQIYINPEKLTIDLSKIKNGIYRIIAVHNFQVEDTNPDLRECLAGIFLARQVGGRWEEPEDRTIECRTIEILALLTRKKGMYFIHDYK